MKPSKRNTFATEFRFGGDVTGIIRELVSRISQIEGFTLNNFRGDPSFECPSGAKCWLNVTNNFKGAGTVCIRFSVETKASERERMSGMAEALLVMSSSRGSVLRRDLFFCANGHPIDLACVQYRIELGRDDLPCQICDDRTPIAALVGDAFAVNIRRMARSKKLPKAPRKSAEEIARIAAAMIHGCEKKDIYDVFLCHNSKDKREVELIGKKLKRLGIRPWFDKWDLDGGSSWITRLQLAIDKSKCAAVLLGPNGNGDWQAQEMDVVLQRAAKRELRVVPVLLPGANPELPPFFSSFNCVDMTAWRSRSSDAFYRLICGIVGKQPGDAAPKMFSAIDVRNWKKQRK